MSNEERAIIRKALADAVHGASAKALAVAADRLEDGTPESVAVDEHLRNFAFVNSEGPTWVQYP